MSDRRPRLSLPMPRGRPAPPLPGGVLLTPGSSAPHRLQAQLPHRTARRSHRRARTASGAFESPPRLQAGTGAGSLAACRQIRRSVLARRAAPAGRRARGMCPAQGRRTAGGPGGARRDPERGGWTSGAAVGRQWRALGIAPVCERASTVARVGRSGGLRGVRRRMEFWQRPGRRDPFRHEARACPGERGAPVPAVGTPGTPSPIRSCPISTALNICPTLCVSPQAGAMSYLHEQLRRSVGASP